MTVGLVKVLVLAGTAEARAVIDGLRSEGRFDITASLAGATPNPAPLPVPTISGGFGGAEGLAAHCRDQGSSFLSTSRIPSRGRSAAMPRMQPVTPVSSF